MPRFLLLACAVAIVLALKKYTHVPHGNNPTLRARLSKTAFAAYAPKDTLLHKSGARQSHDVMRRQKKAAICVSGQLRTLGETVQRIRTHLLDVIDDYDIFMYVQTQETMFEPAVGNVSVCDVFKRTPSNRIFCEVARERKLVISDFFTDDMRASYYFKEDRPVQGLLQQLLGIAESNRMRQEHMAASGTAYEYTIRLRPDNWFYDDIPALPPITDANRRTVYIVDPNWKCCGNEDIFQVGPTEVMDILMNRLVELKNFSKPLAAGDGAVAWHRLLPAPPKNAWSAEHFAVLFAEKHNISMQAFPGLHVHIKRFDDKPGSQNSGSHP